MAMVYILVLFAVALVNNVIKLNKKFCHELEGC